MREINILEDSALVLKDLSKGVLLSVKDGEQINTMTIGWGSIGIEWSRPIFTACIRLHRASKEMIDRAGCFTISAPYQKDVKDILGFCGTRSYREVDKIKAMGLSLHPTTSIDGIAIEELPVTLECKVLYRQDQILEDIPPELQNRYYPQDIDGLDPGKNKDVHCMYIAEITKAYIL